MLKRIVPFIYGLYILLSIALFVSTEPFEKVEETSNRRLSETFGFSAFEHLTNHTPSKHDVIVAIRCDLVRDDEMIDICTPSSPLSPSSKRYANFVQRDAIAYDLEMNTLFKRDTLFTTALQETPKETPKETPTDKITEIHNSDNSFKDLQIALASLLLACVVIHTLLVAFSTQYLKMVMNHSRFVMMIRIVLPSLTFSIGTIATLKENTLTLVLSALLYMTQLAEGCLLYEIPDE